LLALLAMLGAAWWGLSIELCRLETAAWETRSFADLASREPLLHWIARRWIMPASTQARAQGLLGDLARHRGEHEMALAHYTQELVLLSGLQPAPNATLTDLVPDLVQGTNEFGLGFNDYRTSTAETASVDDADLALDYAANANAAAANWAALTAIPAPLEPEAVLMRDAPRANAASQQALLARHQGAITALRCLQSPLFPPDPDDFSSLPKLSAWVPLLALDAMRQADSGNMSDAGRSLDAAYLLIGVLEENPRMVTLLIAHGLREVTAELLESEAGCRLRWCFGSQHVLSATQWERTVAGEYQAVKRWMTESMAGTDPMAARLRQHILAKQAAHWREMRTHGGKAHAAPPVSLILADWFGQNRQFFHRLRSSSRADGQRVASELEGLIAEIVHRVAVPNVGNLIEQLVAMRAREVLLAANAGQPR